MTASYPARLIVVVPVESISVVTNLMSRASPDESVTDEPVISPSAFFKITLAPDTALESATTLMSTVRILLNIPFPVTDTEFVSTFPSMKLTFEDPVINTSWLLPNVLSIMSTVPLPAVSIPIALVARFMLLNETSAVVADPYLIAAPAELAIVPESSPDMSLM